MTEPSTITTPTLEQRAAAINEFCPGLWCVRAQGSSLVIYAPNGDMPHAAVNGSDLAVLATLWRLYAGTIEQKRDAMALKLAEVVAEFSVGMFTPADFVHRAVDVDEALREIRERRRLDREERDAREAALVKAALDARREAVRCGEEVVAARLKLAEIVAEFSAGMFTPADFIKRAVDVDEALREIRERRRLDREERDARFVASEASRETEIVRLRDQLAEAHDYARREMVWVPASAGMSTSEQVADAIRQETGAEVEPRPHSRPNVLDEVRGLGEATERFDRAAVGGLLPDGSIDAEFKVQVPVAVIADMFPLAERIVCIDPHAMVDGEHERVLFDNGPGTYARDQASVVCAVLPNGDINVLKNRRGQAGRWSFQPGISFAEMVWTGSAWVPLRRPMGFAGDAPVAVGEAETGPYSKQETLDADAFALKYGPRALGATSEAVRAAGWTGITWMSGKGRAKSLTVPGLQTRGDLGPNALRSAEMERLSQKTVKVLQRRDRLYAFHLPGGVKRYGHVDTWGHLRAGEPLTISIRPPEGKAVRQGIAWRRPGHDVDSFAEVPIRPTFDGDGGQVIEVRGELPGDLQHEIRQTSRDRLTITVTTANGAKITGPVTAWRVARSPECVVWHLTVPLRSPPPRT